MFMYHSALALSLLALAAGCALFILGHRIESCGKRLARFFGVFIIIISLLSTICTIYVATMYWKAGLFKDLIRMHQMRMIDKNDSTKATTETKVEKDD